MLTRFTTVRRVVGMILILRKEIIFIPKTLDYDSTLDPFHLNHHWSRKLELIWVIAGVSEQRGEGLCVMSCVCGMGREGEGLQWRLSGR